MNTCASYTIELSKTGVMHAGEIVLELLAYGEVSRLERSITLSKVVNTFATTDKLCRLFFEGNIDTWEKVAPSVLRDPR